MSFQSNEIESNAAANENSNVTATTTGAAASATATTSAAASASVSAAASASTSASASVAASAAANTNADEPHADNDESAQSAPADDTLYMINAHSDSWSGVLPPYQLSHMEQLQLEGSYELMQRDIAARRKKEEAREVGLALKEELKAGAAFEIATTMDQWEATHCVHPQCPRKGNGMAAGDCYVMFSSTQPPHEQALVCWECLEELWDGECLAAVLGGQ